MIWKDRVAFVHLVRSLLETEREGERKRRREGKKERGREMERERN